MFPCLGGLWQEYHYSSHTRINTHTQKQPPFILLILHIKNSKMFTSWLLIVVSAMLCGSDAMLFPSCFFLENAEPRCLYPKCAAFLVYLWGLVHSVSRPHLICEAVSSVSFCLLPVFLPSPVAVTTAHPRGAWGKKILKLSSQLFSFLVMRCGTHSSFKAEKFSVEKSLGSYSWSLSDWCSAPC